jgi:AraC-like DNA-binding protein
MLDAEHPLSLDTLAARVGLSKCHLARQFARHVGAAPLRYQNERRLQAAARLLSAGWRPIDVAHHLCFADQAHLSRLFKRRFGVPPRAYARLSPLLEPARGPRDAGASSRLRRLFLEEAEIQRRREPRGQRHEFDFVGVRDRRHHRPEGFDMRGVRVGV